MYVLRNKLFSSSRKKRSRDYDDDDDDLVYIPASAISNHRGAGRSLIIGGLGGAIGGLVAKEDIVDSISQGDRDYRKIKNDATKKGAAVGGIAGTAIGGLISLKKGEIAPVVRHGVLGAVGGGLGARKNASKSIELANLYESDLKRFENYKRNQKRKSFSKGDDSEGGMGTLGKVGLGLAATAGTFYGARKGLLGSKLQMHTNAMWGKLGGKLGSESMMKSASRDFHEGRTNFMMKNSGYADNYNKLSEANRDKFDKLVSNMKEKHGESYADLFANGKFGSTSEHIKLAEDTAAAMLKRGDYSVENLEKIANRY
jgi:hypothetical protein